MDFKQKKQRVAVLLWAIVALLPVLVLATPNYTKPTVAHTDNHIQHGKQQPDDVALDGAYENHYAQDFGRCAWHFYQKTPPKLSLEQSVGAVYELCFYGFATLYSATSKTALYSAHHLRAGDLEKARQLRRTDSFRPETRLPKDLQVSLADYKGQGYDRGHIVPNGDMYDKQSQYDSFSLANIVPQNKEHNRGIWRQIESYTRDLASEFGEVYVVTGVAFHDKQSAVMNGVMVPSHLYKAIYIPSENIAGVYYSPNDGSGHYEVITINALHERTGVMVFAKTQARFNRSLFLLDTPIEQPSWGFWEWVVMIALALWQALA